MERVELSVPIAGPAHAIYELMTRMERFPDFIPDVERVVVRARTPDGSLLEWHATFEDAPVEWVQENRFDPSSREVRFRALSGDFDHLVGAWTVREVDGYATLGVVLEFDFDLPTLGEIVAPIIRLKVEDNAAAMLVGVKTLIERGEAR